MKSEFGRPQGWIGVDLDGTLAHYDGWKGPEHVGAPIQEMLQRVQAWLLAGHQIKIFTARVSSDGSARRDLEAAKARFAIASWCDVHIGQVLPITNIKDYGMVELWDDRAVQVHANKGVPVGKSPASLDAAPHSYGGDLESLAWAGIAQAAVRVARSPGCTSADSEALRAAIDRLAAAILSRDEQQRA